MQLDANSNSYDTLPYDSYPRPPAHPRNLELIAALLGLAPPPVEKSRILELGCGTGGNILPIASSLPQSRCLGIDYSQVQIDIGRKIAEDAKLTNLELHHRSILDIDRSLGSFDYIICHGVFSWVPPVVKQKILSICNELLTPDGIAFVSYNTHPGWHQRGVLRDMLKYNAERFPNDSPREQIRRAREFLHFLSQANQSNNSSYALMLREQVQLLESLPDSYLFHEHLEQFNEPEWFLDFCNLLGMFGLRYLADADFSSMVADSRLSPDIRSQLVALAPSLLEREQYLDFVFNRSFRQSLICHQHQKPMYDVRADRLEKLFVASAVRRISTTKPLSDPELESFQSPDGLTLSTPLPIFRAALAVLSENWPDYIPFELLFRLAEERLIESGVEDGSDDTTNRRQSLARSLLTTYSSSTRPLVLLATTPPKSPPPKESNVQANSLARTLVANGSYAVNSRHENVALTPFDEQLLLLLDGTRSLDEVIESITSDLRSGRLEVKQTTGESGGAEATTALAAEFVKKQLRFFHHAGLFV